MKKPLGRRFNLKAVAKWATAMMIVAFCCTHVAIAQTNDKRYNTDAAALEAFVSLKIASAQGSATYRGQPNWRTFARQTLEDVEHRALQKPESVLVLIGSGHQGICAWVWFGRQVSGYWLAEEGASVTSIAPALAKLNLPGRSSRVLPHHESPSNVAVTLNQWSEQWFPTALKQVLLQAKEIVLVPMDELAALPWNAMVLQVLGSEAEARSVIVASNFKSALDIRLLWEPINSGDQVLVVGNPDFSGKLPQLFGAQVEAEFYANSFKVPAVLGADATIARVSSELGAADVAFLATYCGSELNNASPDAHLILSDGKLTALDIRAMKFLKKSVIVLSACESSLGEGRLSKSVDLAWAFEKAGAAGVVMSLWSGDDDVTRLLMQYFVEELRTAPPSLALMRSQIRIKTKYPDPRHWGGFNYFGTPISMK
jgi:hypothetical protein